MLGDFTPGKSVVFDFNTHKADGTPITLAGTPVVSVYKNSTTETTTGVTLTVDYDSRTGLHHVVIDTSADGTFYAAGNDFRAVITTGTVDSISVVGSVIGSFSLSNRSALRPATADRTLVVDAAGLADVNTVKLGPSGSGTAQTARDVGASVLLSSGTGTGQISLSSGTVTVGTNNDKTGYALASNGLAAITAWTVAITGNITGNLSGSVGSIATNGIAAASFAAASLTAIAAAVWNALTSGLTTSGSAGKLLVDNLNAPIDTRMATFSYTSPPTASDNAIAVWGAGSRTITDKSGFSIAGTITTLDGLKSGIDTTIGNLNNLSESDIIDAIAGSVLVDSDYLNRIADHVRRRQQANVEASTDGDALSLSSEYGMIQQVQESAVSGGTWTIKRTDGTTTLGTKTATSSAGAEPIVSVS